MFKLLSIKNVFCFDLDSSIYTYLKYRQFILFVYIFILLVIFCIYSMIFCYWYDSLFSYSYTHSNYLNVGLRNLVNNIFIFLNNGFFDHSLFFKDGFDANHLDDRHFLYNLYRSTLDLPSTYSLYLELSGWKDWCSPCRYRGVIPNASYKDASIPVIFGDGSDLDYGSFFNYSTQSVPNNDRLYMSFQQMNNYFDSKAIKTGLLYTDSNRFMQDYLNISMLNNPAFSNLYDLRDITTVDLYDYKDLFSKFESKKVKNYFNHTNMGTCYINVGVEKLGKSWSVSDCLGSNICGDVIPSASFYVDKSMNDYFSYGVDELENHLIVNDYALKCILNDYCDLSKLLSLGHEDVKLKREYVDIYKSEQAKRIESNYKFIRHYLNFYDTILKNYDYRGSSAVSDAISDYKKFKNLFSIDHGKIMPTRFLDADSSIVCDYVNAYVLEILNYWSKFFEPVSDDKLNKILDSYTKINDYNHYNKSIKFDTNFFNCNDDLANFRKGYLNVFDSVKSFAEDIYKNCCMYAPSVNGFTGYARSTFDSLFEHPKYVNYTPVYAYEFDVSSMWVKPLNMNVDDLFSYFELNKDIDSKSIRYENSFGLHNLYYFEDSGLGISPYDFTDLKKYILEGYFRSDIYTLFSHVYGISSILLVKVFTLIYPFLLVAICTFLFFHIVYAYEFLLNDYIECVQIRALFSSVFFVSAFLFFYLFIFKVFLTDFYSVNLFGYGDLVISDSHNIKNLGIYNLLFNSEECFMDMYLNMYNLEYNIPFKPFSYVASLFLVPGSIGASFHYWRIAMRTSLIALVFVTIGTSFQKGFLSFVINFIKRTFFTTFPYKAEYIYDDESRVVGYKENDEEGHIHLYDIDGKFKKEK